MAKNFGKIVVGERPLRRGHQAHKSGSGAMEDRRTKRERTRGSQSRKALGEW